ncbi:MAG TPA: (2Fe-2S)-binding protein [Planctomycetaceae bacterium]|nr:(2Fe-2S)-binding protein [Planctomycetaceae bacterium]
MQDQSPQSRSGYSRRDFLKGTAAATAASAAVLSEHESAEAATTKVASAQIQEITLSVNGKEHVLQLEPRANLLDVLRNDLNLTGCKEVCETTNCGACTVMIDGKATYACSRLAIECQGKKIATVESLTANGQQDKVAEGFLKNDAMQCGYCTPGFVMATKAFLQQHPKASLEEIQKGLGGNICRCGTYHGITQCAVAMAQKGEA